MVIASWSLRPKIWVDRAAVRRHLDELVDAELVDGGVDGQRRTNASGLHLAKTLPCAT
jgi:hypothetical protein